MSQNPSIEQQTDELAVEETQKGPNLQVLEAENQHLVAYSNHLKQLHQLLTFNYPNLQAFYEEVVKVGANVFEMPIGILSRIEGEDYFLEAVWSDCLDLSVGARFDLGNTYCSEVVKSQSTLSYAHVGADPSMKGHPIYIDLKLESYISTPVFVEGELYGTLNFSSFEVRKAGFNQHELEYIELMGQAIGKEIAIYKSKAEREQINEDLVKSNLELDRFAYIVSHDLKAPLRAISNLSDWIEEDLGDGLEEEVQGYLDLMKSRVHRLSTLVDGILKYSRVGRKDVEVRKVSVRSLLDNVVDLLSPPESVVLLIPEELPVIETMHIRLQQIFQNLLSNALGYNDKSQPKIEVLYEDCGDHYQFGVKDNGPGIAAEHHERVFVMFQTLVSRDQRESTGVGLTIVKKAVEEMGGRIWIESEEGKGCTFHFTWPKQPLEQNN